MVFVQRWYTVILGEYWYSNHQLPIHHVTWRALLFVRIRCCQLYDTNLSHSYVSCSLVHMYKCMSYTTRSIHTRITHMHAPVEFIDSQLIKAFVYIWQRSKIGATVRCNCTSWLCRHTSHLSWTNDLHIRRRLKEVHYMKQILSLNDTLAIRTVEWVDS